MARSRMRIDPSPRRSATANDVGARIMTPSRTACPPMYGRAGVELGARFMRTTVRRATRSRERAESRLLGRRRLGRRRRRGGGRFLLGVTLLEAVDAARRVHELLRAGVEGVAVGA